MSQHNVLCCFTTCQDAERGETVGTIVGRESRANRPLETQQYTVNGPGMPRNLQGDEGLRGKKSSDETSNWCPA